MAAPVSPALMAASWLPAMQDPRQHTRHPSRTPSEIMTGCWIVHYQARTDNVNGPCLVLYVACQPLYVNGPLTWSLVPSSLICGLDFSLAYTTVSRLAVMRPQGRGWLRMGVCCRRRGWWLGWPGWCQDPPPPPCSDRVCLLPAGRAPHTLRAAPVSHTPEASCLRPEGTF